MSTNGQGFLPIDAYVKIADDIQTYVIKPILPQGGGMVIYAKEKKGKSAMAIQLMHAVGGSAQHWMGFPVETYGRVLYLQVDTPGVTWRNRFKILMRHGWVFNNDAVRIADKTLSLIHISEPTRPY